MNSKVTYPVVFIAGAAVGAMISWRFLKTRYEHIAQEEIDSVKAVYSKKATNNTANSADTETKDDEHAADVAKDISQMIRTIEKNRYSNKTEKEEKVDKDPYVISPDEFGDEDEYTICSLTYYADGVLVDENDEPVNNVDELVGEDSLNHFGEYEDDSVYVRNDILRCDFEILLDNRTYSDVLKEKPYLQRR